MSAAKLRAEARVRERLEDVVRALDQAEAEVEVRRKERDELIEAGAELGMSSRELGRLTGLSHVRVGKIIAF